MNLPNIKKLLIKVLLVETRLIASLLCFSASSFAADFIVPNSSGEPIVIDVSDLNLITGIDVSIGEFTDQPRSYRDSNTKSIAIFPPAASDSEKTIQIRSGSTTISKTVSFRSSPNGDLKNSLLPDLHEARAGNTATKISDGRIVLTGGSKGFVDGPLSSLEVFNPEIGKSEFLKTPDNSKKTKLQIPRSQHTATYLGISNSPVGMIPAPVEQILLTGGFSTGGTLENSIEIVEINVGTNQAISTLLTSKKAKLKKARIYHTASVLPDGRVLIIGGQGRINKTNLGALNSIEIFDPVTRTVLSSGISLSVSRLLHTATILQNGNILIAGGFANEKTNAFGLGPATAAAELIDTKNFTIKNVGLLRRAVGGHSATLLTNGQVLIVGGNTDLFAGTTSDNGSARGLSLGTLQYYDNSNESFNLVTDKSTGGILELLIPRFLFQSILLPNGDIAVVGGLNIKQGSNTENFINTPVSKIEIFTPDLITSTGSVLKISQKNVLDTSTGRVQPTVILVTPKNKTQGFLSASDAAKFVNSGVYLTGGFTNGLGKLPSKASEFLQIELNSGIEGRQIILTPDAAIQGSYISEFLVGIDKFSIIPSLQVQPQTINLSSSNNFIATTKVLSTNGEVALLKAQINDPNGAIIVSPSLFQVGESITFSRKDSNVQGEFEVDILPTESTANFIPAKIKVNVSDSSKPFLSTVPPYGISLNTEIDNNLQKLQVKVLSQDGTTEFSSVPNDTSVTATISNPDVANLGGTGISSVTGNLLTQFQVNALKPGKTDINFSINFPNILGISIPLEVSGTPTFSAVPIGSSVQSELSSNNGIEFSGITKQDPLTVSLDDLMVSPVSSLFPVYIPINLQSSIDNSVSIGLFTIRPIFGVDLLTARPRTFVNETGTDFKSPLSVEPLAIGGFVSEDSSEEPIAVLASDDGIRAINFSEDNQNITGPLNMISNASSVKDIKLFEFGSDNKKTKIVALKGAMVLLLNAEFGEIETSASLSGEGTELELTEINGQTAAVVSVGVNGVDLVFPITDTNPRVENSRVAASVEHIAVVKKLGSQTGPFVIAYDDTGIISIVNLVNVDSTVQKINTGNKKFTKIDYAGKFLVNGKTTDVLICSSQRSVALFDLNNLTSIPIEEDLKIKNNIEDLLVIDGTAYLALGDGGVLALSIGGLIDNNKQATITTFTNNKLTIVKSNGKETFVTKSLNANKLADARPFLLSSGVNNNLTVIRVSP